MRKVVKRALHPFTFIYCAMSLYRFWNILYEMLIIIIYAYIHRRILEIWSGVISVNTRIIITIIVVEATAALGSLLFLSRRR